MFIGASLGGEGLTPKMRILVAFLIAIIFACPFLAADDNISSKQADISELNYKQGLSYYVKGDLRKAAGYLLLSLANDPNNEKARKALLMVLKEHKALRDELNLKEKGVRLNIKLKAKNKNN